MVTERLVRMDSNMCTELKNKRKRKVCLWCALERERMYLFWVCSVGNVDLGGYLGVNLKPLELLLNCKVR